MGEAKRKQKKQARVGLIVPTTEEARMLTGTELAAADVGAVEESTVPKAKTELSVTDEIDSMVRVIGKAIETDMQQREVRTVSVLAALFRCTSNIAKTYLTQCARGEYLEEGRDDVVKLTEIQDADLAKYIAALTEGMTDDLKPH